MQTLFLFLFFIVSSYISFYLMGKLVINILKLKLEENVEFIISWVLGLCIFLLITYALAWINTGNLLYVIIVFVLFLSYQKKILLPRYDIKKIDKAIFFILLAGVLCFISLMWFSGFETEKGLQIIGSNNLDGIAHLAHIKNELIFFPPSHPGLANVAFRGYHYFYDFLLSRFSLFYHFSPEDLYFRFFPVLISFLYGSSFYLAGLFITKEQNARRLILFLAFFAQNFSFFLLFLNRNFERANSPQLVQPIGLIIDPSIVLTTAILLCVLTLLPKIKKSKGMAAITGIMLGILCQTKVYSGMIGILALVIYTTYIFLKDKKNFYNYFITLCISGFLTVLTFLPNNLGVGKLIFAPFLLYSQYMQQSIFDSLHWEIRKQIFQQHGNIIRIVLMYVEAIGIFWFINLGIRTVLFLHAGALISKKFWVKDYNFIFFFSIIIPVVIASFFIQSIAVFDIAQLLWIDLALMSIPTGIVLSNIIARKNKFQTAIIFFVLFIGIIQCVLPVYSYLFTSRNIIPKKDVTLYRKISKIVPQKSFIVSLPPAHDSMPFISAMTGRSVYYEGEIIHYPLDNIYNERGANLSLLQEAVKTCDIEKIKILMRKINTKYLYTYFNTPCLNKSSIVLSKYENGKHEFFVLK